MLHDKLFILFLYTVMTTYILMGQLRIQVNWLPTLLDLTGSLSLSIDLIDLNVITVAKIYV